MDRGRRGFTLHQPSRPYDCFLAGGVSLALGAIVGVAAYALLGFAGFYGYLAAFAAGPVCGGVIAEVVRRSVGRRRVRYLNLVIAAALVVGVLLGGILATRASYAATLATYGASVDMLSYSASAGMLALGPMFLLQRVDVLLLAALAASTIYARLQ